MTTTPVKSNSCGLTKIKISDSKIYSLVGLENLHNSTLLSPAKLTSRPKLIVKHIFILVLDLDIEEDKFAGISQ